MQYLQKVLSPWLIKDVIQICASYDAFLHEINNIPLPLTDYCRGYLFSCKNNIFVITHEGRWGLYVNLNKELMLMDVKQEISVSWPQITLSSSQRNNNFDVDWRGGKPFFTKSSKTLFQIDCNYIELKDILVTENYVFWSKNPWKESPLLYSWSFATQKIHQVLSKNDFRGFLEPINNVLVVSEDGRFIILATYHQLFLYNTESKTVVEDIYLVDKGHPLFLLRLDTTSFLILQGKTIRLMNVRLSKSDTK
jgi:hypothetical protein